MAAARNWCDLSVFCPLNSQLFIVNTPDEKLVKSNIVSNTVSRESREKTFTINLRQKKAEIKQLLAPLLCLCLVEEINGRRKKWFVVARQVNRRRPDITYFQPYARRTKILFGIFQTLKSVYQSQWKIILNVKTKKTRLKRLILGSRRKVINLDYRLYSLNRLDSLDRL